jgi:cytochrome oxidase assembly protein ShyY1
MRHYGLRVLLLRGRWLVGHVLVAVVVITFVSLGFWQLARDDQKQEKVRAAEAAYAAPAPPLEAGTVVPGDRVEARGTYDPDGEALLRNRVRGDRGGVDVLTPLVLDDGTAVIVDRGWLPGSASTAPVPPPPTGEVVVRGILRESRALGSDDEVTELRDLPSVPRVDVEVLQQPDAAPLLDEWIEAQYQDPPPGDDDPELPTPPPPDSVNHYQYALQWFGLALIPLVGWPIVCTRALRRHRAEQRPAAASH